MFNFFGQKFRFFVFLEAKFHIIKILINYNLLNIFLKNRIKVRLKKQKCIRENKVFGSAKKFQLLHIENCLVIIACRVINFWLDLMTLSRIVIKNSG